MYKDQLDARDFEFVISWINQRSWPPAMRDAAQQVIRSTAEARKIRISDGWGKGLRSALQSNRQKIAQLRGLLKDQRLTLPDGNEYSIEIPFADKKRGEKKPDAVYTARFELSVHTSQVRQFWQPHLQSDRKLSIFVFERLFFRIGGCYVRKLTVNDIDEFPQLSRELGLNLKDRAGEKKPRPSSHYLSAGESAGAFVLQDMMFDTFGRHCSLRSDGTYAPKENDIVLASPRRGENMLVSPYHFPPHENGFGQFKDKTDGERWINVSVRREVRPQERVTTLISSHHGRASEYVCASLCDPNFLRDRIMPLFRGQGVTPEKFEIIFLARLRYTALGYKSFADHIEIQQGGVWSEAANAKIPT